MWFGAKLAPFVCLDHFNKSGFSFKKCLLHHQPDLFDYVSVRAPWLPDWDPIHVLPYFHLIDMCFFAPSSIWNGCGRDMGFHLCFPQYSNIFFLIRFVTMNINFSFISKLMKLWYPELSPMAGVRWRWPGQCFQANVPYTVCNQPIASHYSQTAAIRTTMLFQTLKPHWQCLTAVLRSFSCVTGLIWSCFPGQRTTWSFFITISCNFSPHFASSFLRVFHSNWHCF